MVKQIVSSGLSWNMLERGEGERSLVFLPGTLGSVEIHNRQIETFSANSHVVVLGYPGSVDLPRLSDSFWDILN